MVIYVFVVLLGVISTVMYVATKFNVSVGNRMSSESNLNTLTGLVI